MQFPLDNPVIITLLFIWSALWKGFALWRAVKLNQRNWYISMIVINSLGLLELAYLFIFAKKKLTIKEIKSWFLNHS